MITININKIKTGCIAIALFCLSSCEVMDTQPFDKFSEDVVWGNKTNADAFVFSTYSQIFKDVYAAFPDWQLWDYGSWNGYLSQDMWTNNNINSSGYYPTREIITREDDFGFGKFDLIRRCNLIMEKASSSTGLSDTEKKELIAEAKFLRASVYFFLAKRFGIVVWIDKVLTTKEETYKLPTTPDVKTTYDHIIKDLEEAGSEMPKEALSGRANRYAAFALLSEVCLQAAAYTSNSTLYQKAINAADSVINSGIYSLDNDYGSMFNEDGPYSREIILGAYRNSGNTWCELTGMLQCLPNVSNDQVKLSNGSPLFKVDRIFEGWIDWSPSQNLVDDYLVIDKNTGKAVRWDQTTQFKNSVVKVSPTGTILDAGNVLDNSRINDLMYLNRDNRFYGTIVYDSCEWFNETVTTCLQGNLCRNLTEPNYWGTTVTNYYWRKGMYKVSPRAFYQIPTDYHWVIFRLGRVYLNKAEALLQQGKVSDAVAAFNQTRTIHGKLPPSEATSLNDAWTDYKRERRVDLALEGDYYWSLLRWGKYGGPANSGQTPGAKITELITPPTLIDITKDRKHYQISNVTIGQNNLREFDEQRRYLLPIPQSQRNLNENLGQNPNW